MVVNLGQTSEVRAKLTQSIQASCADFGSLRVRPKIESTLHGLSAILTPMTATNPAYIQRLLAQARADGQWHAYQPDCAALCFEVLALLPDHAEAAELVYELFCDEWLVYDNRNAIQQNIDEWDDRPPQQRRRLALSFRFMSRWQGKYAEYVERRGPKDVRQLLHQGEMELISAYCLGDDECTAFAWPLLAEAIERAKDPRLARLWVGFKYADLGFFADAVEVLADLCSRDPDPEARRLLAEVKWWRDNAHRVPWIPPAGDGSRYKHMMTFINPNAPSDEEVIQFFRERGGQREARHAQWQPTISPELAALVNSALPDPEHQPPAKLVVDWGFLDTDDGQPGELPEWAKKQMRLFRHNPTSWPISGKTAVGRARLNRPAPHPATTPTSRRLIPRRRWPESRASGLMTTKVTMTILILMKERATMLLCFRHAHRHLLTADKPTLNAWR